MKGLKEFNGFKVGQEVTCPMWISQNLKPEVIEFMTDLFFIWINPMGEAKVQYWGETNWIHPPKEVEKDLEGVFEYVTVEENSSGIRVRKWLGDIGVFERHKKNQEENRIEVITLEQAKNRGLKI